jgi:hypothetical protein
MEARVKDHTEFCNSTGRSDCACTTVELRAMLVAAQAENTRIIELLKDPTSVRVNILRGQIVLPPEYEETTTVRDLMRWWDDGGAPLDQMRRSERRVAQLEAENATARASLGQAVEKIGEVRDGLHRSQGGELKLDRIHKLIDRCDEAVNLIEQTMPKETV